MLQSGFLDGVYTSSNSIRTEVKRFFKCHIFRIFPRVMMDAHN